MFGLYRRTQRSKLQRGGMSWHRPTLIQVTRVNSCNGFAADDSTTNIILIIVSILIILTRELHIIFTFCGRLWHSVSVTHISTLPLFPVGKSCVQSCILVYKSMHGLAPCYLNEMCIPVSTVPNLSALRSAARGDLVVHRTMLQLGNRAFCVAGPVAWNRLPLQGHSFRTYIINVQKHAQDTSFLSFLLH